MIAMNAYFEWPVLWVFPMCLLILAFLLALAALMGWRKQRFSIPMLVVLALATVLCFAVGMRHLLIANSPRMATEKATYRGEQIEHLSFSPKYQFVNENGDELVLRFPYVVSHKQVTNEKFIPGCQYSIIYESTKNIIVEAKKENATPKTSSEKIITDTYSDKEAHYASVHSIQSESILPFSIAVIALVAMVLFGINADTKFEKAVIGLIGILIIVFCTFRGVHYVKIAKHPVIIETRTSLVMLNEESRSDWIEMDFVDEVGNRLMFYPKRNSVESYLGVEELEYGEYWLIYEAQSNTLLDIRQENS